MNKMSQAKHQVKPPSWVKRSRNLVHWDDLLPTYGTRAEAGQAADKLRAAEKDDLVVYQPTGFGD